MLVSIYRYNPETDDKPYTQSLEIKLPEGKDLMVGARVERVFAGQMA